MKDLEVRDRLLMLYKDYENKIISEKEIIRFVRDVYYQEVTGKSYEEWSEVMGALSPELEKEVI